MTQLREIYKCAKCGNVVEMVREGAGDLICCEETMEKLVARTEDTGKEKHVPVIEETPNGVLVKVGDVPHPMEEKHYIKFIEILTATMVLRAELNPGQAPQAEFPVSQNTIVEVREYCTLHNLWKA